MPNEVQVVAPDMDDLFEIVQRLNRPASSGMSFTTGLLLGQLSVVLLVIVCFKYLLLEDVRYGRKVQNNECVFLAPLLIRWLDKEDAVEHER